jgi:signal peptidase I
VREEQYPLMEMAGKAAAWQELGLPVPPRLQSGSPLTGSMVFSDYLAVERAWLETMRCAMPHDRRYATRLARHSKWYVPEGRILPMGDNRDNSRDGRHFGPVRQTKVLGRGAVIFWPLSRISPIR